MRPAAFLPYLYDTVFRLFPHRARRGLHRIGDPGRHSPVLVTGNFTLTVRRVTEVLARDDVWLLVADSRGINVWCAAGGGHLTHHDVISVIRTSGIGERVAHRELVLPQLAATGVERRKIEEATGWQARWGPARLEDLPAVLGRGRRVRREERLARFPVWERLEMASVWSVWILIFVAPALWLLGGGRLALLAATAIALAVAGMFLAVHRLPMTGRARWLAFAGFAAAATAIGTGLLALLGTATPGQLLLIGGASLVAMAALSVDINGTTPVLPSTVHTRNNRAFIEVDVGRCTGAADCVQVCPRAVLEMNGGRRKVEIQRQDACIQCGACIVQCPEDALYFRYPDGRVVAPATIRSTRVNLLGRRTIQLEDGNSRAAASRNRPLS